MKIIALDYDGVIDISTHQLNFDRELLENVFTLCELYQAKIVLSTSWRCDATPEEEITFKEYCCDNFISSMIFDW